MSLYELNINQTAKIGNLSNSNDSVSRLSEMGLINNSIVRVVKQIFGMSYIKLKDSYLIIRQDIFDNLDKERIR